MEQKFKFHSLSGICITCNNHFFDYEKILLECRGFL
nr:MAG TPA: hypothetical protein [Caudoviricetes sp.]